MPGLLDLPPELLEQIHFAHERLIEAEHENNIGIAEELGHSRLTCRYFEHATRRGFVEKNFAVWILRFPEDASIQKLCAMAVTPDLAVAIRKLILFVDDDHTMEVQNADDPNGLGTFDAAKSLQDPSIRLDNKESSQAQQAAPFTSPKKRVTHAFDNITDSLVPAACLRHRAALMEAFRACKDVDEIWIGNKSLEPELMHRYKLSSRVHGIRPPPEDDGDEQDEDGSEVEDDSENADDDRSGDGEEPANDEFNESSDYGQSEYEDYDEEYSDAEDQGSAGHGEQHDNHSGEGSDLRNEHVPDNRLILFDITLSHSYALHLAAEAGMRPKLIVPFQQSPKALPGRVRVGLTDCAGLVRFKASLERLTHLNLAFVHDQKIPQGNPFEEVGLRLGKQISEGILHMPTLRRLSVNFPPVNSVSAWSILAKAPAIPTLEELNLDKCIMNMNDFAAFVGKHCPTWTSLTINHMYLCSGTKEELGDLYERLSRAPNVKLYRQRFLFLGAEHDTHIDVPGHACCVLLDEKEDEDGFVLVHQTNWIRRKGHDEVMRVLGVMAEHMRS